MGWFVIYTKPQREDEVVKRLKDAGIKAFCPKIRARRFLNRRILEREEPFFPCYIFAEFELKSFFHMIKYTRGVKYILFKDMPRELNPLVINTIVERMDEKGFVKVGEEKFTSGERVVIKHGPFKDFLGVFERRLNRKERVILLLEALNARIEIDECMVERA